MRKTVIILNGECKSDKYLKHLCSDAEFIICADGGYKHARRVGVKPNLVLGDFDSSDVPDNVRVMKFLPEKDFSDGELAVKTAKEEGYDEIILTCALGGRTDHALFNLMLLDENVYISEENERIFSVSGSIALRENPGTVFSIVPTESSVISIRGAKYMLENEEISWGGSLTLSNETTDALTEITVKKGKIILFVNK